jgi:hypothetical protein
MMQRLGKDNERLICPVKAIWLNNNYYEANHLSEVIKTTRVRIDY